MPFLVDQSIGSTGLTGRANPQRHEDSFKAMKAALATGANFWNGGELYGPPNPNSLQLLNAYFCKYPGDAQEVIISIKGGQIPGQYKPDGSAKNVRRSADECLRVLDGKKKLDLFDSNYIKQGKLGGISLSECSADSIRRAAEVHEISAVEVEFSMFSLDILENGVTKACAELDIPTGQIRSFDDNPEGDFRKHASRFQPGAFEENMMHVQQMEQLAQKKNCTPGQVAIVWRRRTADATDSRRNIAIPEATTPARVEENNKVIDLTEDDMRGCHQ